MKKLLLLALVLTLTLAVTYDDTDMTDSKVVNSNLTLKWKFNSDSTIEFAVIWNQSSWLGIGFGSRMKNTDMFVVNIVGSTLQLIDLYATGTSTPPADSSNDLTIISQSILSTGWKIRFSRKLNTGDSKDLTLTKGSSYTFCYAYSSATSLEMHSSFSTFSITLTDSSSTTTTSTGTTSTGTTITGTTSTGTTSTGTTTTGTATTGTTSTGTSSTGTSSSGSDTSSSETSSNDSHESNENENESNENESNESSSSGSSSSPGSSSTSGSSSSTGSTNSDISLTSSTSTGRFTDTDMTSSLIVDNNLTLKWKFNTDSTIDFVVLWSKKTWLGIGFGSGMSNVDMVIINLDSSNNVTLLDAYSTSNSSPSADSSNDLTLVSSSVSTSGVKVRFQRKLSTGDTKDKTLALGSKYTFSYAYSNSLTMSQHTATKQFSITLASKQSSTATTLYSSMLLALFCALLLII